MSIIIGQFEIIGWGHSKKDKTTKKQRGDECKNSLGLQTFVQQEKA